MKRQKKSPSSNNEVDDINPTNILRIWNRIVGVVIGFFSTYIFNEIKKLNNQLEVAILTISLFIAWMLLDGYMRPRIFQIWVFRQNKSWSLVILEIMDLVWTLGIFLIVQFLLDLLSDSVDEGDLNGGEKFIGISTIIIIVFSFFQSLKVLHNPKLAKPQKLHNQ